MALLKRMTAGGRNLVRRAGNGSIPGRSAADPPHEEGGLAAAHHETRAMVTEQAAVIQQLRDRQAELEQQLDEAHVASEIIATTSWVRRSGTSPDVLVSVIMPTFDRRPYLERAIESVRCQSHRRLEIIVVDDGSTDTTQEYLASVEDGRLRVLRHDRNRGAFAARNTGLDQATGDLVVHLDSDNFFDPDWVRSVVWGFDTYPEHHHLYGVRVFDDVERAHDVSRRGLPGLQLLRWDAQAVLQNNRVDMNVLAHRRTSLRFDADTETFGDWEFLLQLLHRYDAPLRLPVLAAYYTTDAPDRLMLREEVRRVADYERVRKRWSRLGE